VSEVKVNKISPRSGTGDDNGENLDGSGVVIIRYKFQ
jgi:hypothetical protein